MGQNGIACGFGIIFAQLVGAKENEKLKKVIALSSMLMTIFAVIIISVLYIVFMNLILDFLNIELAIREEAYSYIVVIVGGMIFLAIYNLLVAILRSVGDSVTPLVFLIISNILNIILDIAFVKYLHFGVTGAAWATVITQLICGISCYIYMCVYKKGLVFKWIEIIIDKDIL